MTEYEDLKNDIKEMKSDIKEDIRELKLSLKEFEEEVRGSLGEAEGKREELTSRVTTIEVQTKTNENLIKTTRDKEMYHWQIILTIVTIIGVGVAILAIHY